MTWKEFKDKVEAKGVQDDDHIGYIDIDWSEDPQVERRFVPATSKWYANIADITI